jgi:hypothetical protein
MVYQQFVNCRNIVIIKRGPIVKHLIFNGDNNASNEDDGLRIKNIYKS